MQAGGYRQVETDRSMVENERLSAIYARSRYAVRMPCFYSEEHARDPSRGARSVD